MSGRNANFNQLLELLDVEVKDKMQKEKECVVICKVTVKGKNAYQADTVMDRSQNQWSFAFVFGSSGVYVGKSTSIDLKFLFQKYDKGWRLIKFAK